MTPMMRLTLSASARRPVALLRRALSSEVSGKHVPIGEAGSGYYSDNTKGCYDVIENSTPMMLRATESVLQARAARGAQTSGEPFVIADYGCADAGTSMPMLRQIARKVREAEPKTSILVAYEDQPQNDWISVFNRSQGLIESSSGFDDIPDVTVVGTGVSFYQKCFPNAFVDLMFSATAMHWLRGMPHADPELLHNVMAEPGSASDKAFEAEADGDWRCILSQRSVELKQGGYFGCVSFAKTGEGHFLGRSANVSECMHDNFRSIWRSFVDDGTITQEEFANTNFPMRYRSVEEYTAPFGGAGGASAVDAPVVSAGVSGKAPFEGLSLLAADYGEVKCPYRERWVAETSKSGAAGAARTHAEHYVPTTRTWSNSTFESGLSRQRSPEERAAITESLFSTYVDRVAANPAEHAMDYFHCYLLMRKD